MDMAERRPQLPSLGFLDAEKPHVKEEPYLPRNGGKPATSTVSSTTSPTSRYPPGPPAAYGQSYSTSTTPYPATWRSAHADARTPPSSRRSSGEEKEDVKRGTRQSLPSINDVLANGPPRSFSTSQPPSSSLPPAISTTHLPASPSPKSSRAYTMEPLHFPSKPLNGGYAPAEPVRPVHTPVQDPYSTSHPPHSQSAVKSSHASTYSRPPEGPVTSEPPYGPPSAPAGPPSFGYGYAAYPPRYATQPPPPPPGVSAGPIYDPSSRIGPPLPAPAWKSDGAPHVDERPPAPAFHGESVKRHLESFDLETALTDISHFSGSLMDFSRRYGDQMHRFQRGGASLSSLPSIIEIDDMMMKSRSQYDALLKIRELVQSEQVAYDQQAADQRQKLYSESTPSQAEAPHASRAGEDGKNGNFAGPDTKKRRGRAAPPGRCHSCNRAETPEWRRGPDGARTLCNACGLHYAKLTRKNNFSKQNAGFTSSNLRPKENSA